MATHESLTTQQCRHELERFRDRLKANPTDRIAEMNVERLEKALANAKHHDQRVATLTAEREAAAQDREAQRQADVEADLRRRYDQAMPMPTTDEQWDAVKDSVMHKHRLKQMNQHDEQVAQARRSRAYSI